jgi:hypothetical protein
MREWRSVPLGIDFGSSRVRIALGERNRVGEIRLRAVAARDRTEDDGLLPALIEELLLELGTRERRCVLAIGAPDAALRTIRFPKMTWAERLRASRYEAARIADWPTEEEATIVRTHPNGSDGAHAVGVARAVALGERIAAAREAGLRVIAVDHDALALRRHLPGCDVIADVGSGRASVHGRTAAGPLTAYSASGGGDVTRGIAAELNIDLLSAERRKRILGCAGAGITARQGLVTEVCALINRLRARVTVERVAVTGNAARLPGFTKELETASGAFVEMPVPAILQTSEYPEDVLRTAAPDWTLAASLLDWSVAE